MNNNVPSMREFGKGNAIYFEFGSIDDSIEYADKDKFNEDVAKIIISEFESNKALKASLDIRQNFNYQKIFETQILPLLHEQ